MSTPTRLEVSEDFWQMLVERCDPQEAEPGRALFGLPIFVEDDMPAGQAHLLGSRGEILKCYVLLGDTVIVADMEALS